MYKGPYIHRIRLSDTKSHSRSTRFSLLGICWRTWIILPGKPPSVTAPKLWELVLSSASVSSLVAVQPILSMFAMTILAGFYDCETQNLPRFTSKWLAYEYGYSSAKSIGFSGVDVEHPA